MRASISIIFATLCLASTQVTAATYDATLLEPSSAGPFHHSINDQGDVARTISRVASGGNAYSQVNSIWVTDVEGLHTYFGSTNQFANEGYNLRDVIALNDGTFIASREGYHPTEPGAFRQIVRVIPNGGTINTSVGPVEDYDIIVLAEDASALTGAPTGQTPNVFRFAENTANMSANNTGQVAIIVSEGIGSGATQIIRIEADGQSSTVIGSSSATEINLSSPDINDSGEVAWIAQVIGAAKTGNVTHVLNVGDGLAVAEKRIEIEASGGSSLGPSINDDTTVVGYQPSLITRAEVGDAPNDPANVILGDSDINGFVNFIGINDYGQVAYADASGLHVDGEAVVEIGGQFNGQTVTSIFLKSSESFNNNGSVVAEVRTAQEHFGVRFDTDGGTPDNPIVPVSSTPDGKNDLNLAIVNGLGVDAPIWVDPIVATGFKYSLGFGAENFASLVLPTMLPFSQSEFDLSFDYTGGSFLGSIGLGETFDFLAYDVPGIKEFTLFGIDISEMVDPTDPFVVGLTFVAGGFETVLSIEAITVNTDSGPPAPVPLPAGLPLLLSGFGGLFLLRRRSV